MEKNSKAKRQGVIDGLMQKYGVPSWLKPYIYSYIKRNPINAVKRATSFIDIKRKKGEITKEYVKLPNGMVFKIEFVSHVLSLFFYGEERLSSIYMKWSLDPTASGEYKDKFRELAGVAERHMHAIRNLVNGLGMKQEPVDKSVSDLFDYIEGIKDERERIIATGIMIKYSYSLPFGFVFYKAFYPVSSEFMRSFGKAFVPNNELADWIIEKAKQTCSDYEDKEELLNLVRSMLLKSALMIKSQLPLAKKAGIENEAVLLMDISIAYPLHQLTDLGLNVDIENEIKSIKKQMTKNSTKSKTQSKS